MAENELLKKINRELHLTSLENSEKTKASRLKQEDSSEEDNNEETEITLTDEEVSELNELEEVASEQTEDVVNDFEANVLSSDPKLLSKSVIGNNEIDNIADKSGVLNDEKSDKTSSFVSVNLDPDNGFKVVDTTLGVFTVLNNDDKNVLLLDSNKQKIQISIEDFNNLNPFEIKDERLSSVNDFKTAYEIDLKEKEEAENRAAQEENDEDEMDSFSEEQPEETQGLEDLDLEFGESYNRENAVNKDKDEEKKNILSIIQKNLSSKHGVSETIRTDVRSKNRCVLAANKAKSSKEKEKRLNEATPRIKQRRQMSVMESSNKKQKINKKETTQPSAIYTAPGQLTNKHDDFDINKVLTLKDGKFVLVKLEGKNKICYLKLKPKKNTLSINKLEHNLNNVNTFFESLELVSDDFLILEKEFTMKKLRKYESEEVEDIEKELEFSDEDEELDNDSEEEVEDVEEDEVDVEVEEDEEEQPDSIPFSTEINGVRYSGTLYRDEDDEEYDEDDSEEEIEDVEEDEVEEDDDLILQSEEELEELEFPEGLDESVIKANANIYGKNYTVSFCNVKKECVRKAKLEMRKHNIVEAWNALVRGAKSIKC